MLKSAEELIGFRSFVVFNAHERDGWGFIFGLSIFLSLTQLMLEFFGRFQDACCQYPHGLGIVMFHGFLLGGILLPSVHAA